MAGRIPYEVAGRSTRSLHGNIDDAEDIVANMLAHEKSADLT
jgi:hypothetical protein